MSSNRQKLVIGQRMWTHDAFDAVTRCWHTWVTGAHRSDWSMLYVPSSARRERAIDALVEALSETSPRYVFALHWHHRIPDELVDTFEFVNFHATPLPYGRGGSPIENMIARGHDSTVLTAHRMTHGIDDGPIYCQSGPISLSGDYDEICDRFIGPSARMMRRIARGACVAVPQVGEPLVFTRFSPHARDQFWSAVKETRQHDDR